MVVLSWILIVFFTIGATTALGMVGKPREPMTKFQAWVVIILNLLFIFALLIWGVNG